ncbi:MAG: TolC family protein [Gemmatimonadota bacterium]
MRIVAWVLAGSLVAAPAFAQETETVRQVTLQQAVEIALQKNPLLRQAQTTVEQRQFDRLAAYGSFLPGVNLGYGYSNSSTGRLDPTGQSITRTSYTMQLRATYDLFSGLRRFSDVKSSRLSLHAENARLRQTEYQTVLTAKQAFFNAVANRDLVKVEQDRVARQEDQLSFVQQQVQLGRATRSDLLRSQVDLNNAKLALLNAENSARASTFNLAEALGEEQRVEPAEEATLEAAELPFSREQIMTTAMRAGPSVTSAEAATKAAQAAIASARSSYMPNFSFTGGWAWQASDFPPKNRSWSLSVQGSYPLFNGFQRETQLWQAQSRADAAYAQEEAARLALRSDVDAAYNQIEVALAGIDLAEQSVDLSREDLRVTQERYRLGLATILDLQTAQIAVEQAEVDLINRRFDYQIGLAQLESLLGTSLREELPQPPR